MEGAGVRGDSRGPRWGLESLGRKGSPGLVLPSWKPSSELPARDQGSLPAG